MLQKFQQRRRLPRQKQNQHRPAEICGYLAYRH